MNVKHEQNNMTKEQEDSLLFEKCYVKDRSNWDEKRFRMMRMFPHADWYNKLPERFRHKDKLGDFAKMLIKMEAICSAIKKVK